MDNIGFAIYTPGFWPDPETSAKLDDLKEQRKIKEKKSNYMWKSIKENSN